MIKVRYNPFATERYELYTRLTPEECVRRLKERMNTALSLQLLLSREPSHEGPVYGWVWRRGFRLQIVGQHRRAGFGWHVSSHPSRTVASGRLIPMVDGTHIVVSLGMSRFAAAFLTLWLTGVALFAMVFALASLVSPQAILGSAISLAMLAFVGGLYIYSCQVASGAPGGEDEHQFLLELLRRALSAELVVRLER